MNAVTPIKTIAFDCGYTVVSNFYRDFKRVHGLGPTEMRRRYWSEQLREDRLRSGYFVRLSDVRTAEIASSVDSPAGTIDQQIAA
jgi:AraC-like DNA-binding protein